MSEFETTERRSIADWKHEASQQAISAVSQAEDVATKTVRSTGEAQREIMSGASQRFADASREFAHGNAEKMHTLLSFASTAQGGLHDLRECLTCLVEGVIRTNLRLAQEIFLVESPRAYAELQQRFLREYFDAFQQGAEALIRATQTEAKVG